jgi:hypothetical protein
VGEPLRLVIVGGDFSVCPAEEEAIERKRLAALRRIADGLPPTEPAKMDDTDEFAFEEELEDPFDPLDDYDSGAFRVIYPPRQSAAAN